MHTEETPARCVHRLAVLLSAILVASCGGSSGPARPSGGPEGPRAVVTARPQPVSFTRSVELGATLQAPEQVEIAARIEGVVVDLRVDLGDRVSRGDTLARLTAEDFSARAAQTAAELEQAQSELVRVEQLTARDLASREQLEQARTRVRVATAQQRLAGRQLRDTRVIAPFDGAIAQRMVSPGAFVRVGAPLFLLVATSPLRLALDVPERYAGALREGTPVRVQHESGEIEAHVTRVAPVVDPETRTFRVQVEVPAEPTRSQPAQLRPGMYVRARVELGTVEDAMRLPRAAVFEVLGRSRVVEVVEGRARPRDVELIAEEEGAAIVRGVAAGAEVVARSPGLLAPDTPVRAEPAGQAAASAGEPAPPTGGS